MTEQERAEIEEYRRTLTALQALKQRKVREGASFREMRLIYAEIEEVLEVLRHLLKGESRYKW